MGPQSLVALESYPLSPPVSAPLKLGRGPQEFQGKSVDREPDKERNSGDKRARRGCWGPAQDTFPLKLNTGQPTNIELGEKGAAISGGKGRRAGGCNIELGVRGCAFGGFVCFHVGVPVGTNRCHPKAADQKLLKSLGKFLEVLVFFRRDSVDRGPMVFVQCQGSANQPRFGNLL